jgi:hypothetical protein
MALRSPAQRRRAGACSERGQPASSECSEGASGCQYACTNSPGALCPRGASGCSGADPACRAGRLVCWAGRPACWAVRVFPTARAAAASMQWCAASMRACADAERSSQSFVAGRTGQMSRRMAGRLRRFAARGGAGGKPGAHAGRLPVVRVPPRFAPARGKESRLAPPATAAADRPVAKPSILRPLLSVDGSICF